MNKISSTNGLTFLPEDLDRKTISFEKIEGRIQQAAQGVWQTLKQAFELIYQWTLKRGVKIWREFSQLIKLIVRHAINFFNPQRIENPLDDFPGYGLERNEGSLPTQASYRSIQSIRHLLTGVNQEGQQKEIAIIKDYEHLKFDKQFLIDFHRNHYIWQDRFWIQPHAYDEQKVLAFIQGLEANGIKEIALVNLTSCLVQTISVDIIGYLLRLTNEQGVPRTVSSLFYLDKKDNEYEIRFNLLLEVRSADQVDRILGYIAAQRIIRLSEKDLSQDWNQKWMEAQDSKVEREQWINRHVAPSLQVQDRLSRSFSIVNEAEYQLKNWT